MSFSTQKLLKQNSWEQRHDISPGHGQRSALPPLLPITTSKREAAGRQGQCSWRPRQPPFATSSDNIQEFRPLPSTLGFSKTSVTALWHLKTNTSVKLLGGRGRFHVDFGSFCTFPFPLNSLRDWDAASSLLEAWNAPDFRLAFVIKSLRKQSQGTIAI